MCLMLIHSALLVSKSNVLYRRLGKTKESQLQRSNAMEEENRHVNRLLAYCYGQASHP